MRNESDELKPNSNEYTGEDRVVIPQLPSKLNWGIKDMKLFNKYLFEYDKLPSNKKLLSTMIKFEEMYQPITKGPMMVDPFGHIRSANETRKIKRMEVYMNKKDLISTFDDRAGRKIVVTSTGHKIFYEEYPLAKLRKEKWDGVWTIIMYDFPQRLTTLRNYMRRKLKSYGFGSPQISILASPLKLEEPIQQYIEKEGLEKYIWTFRAQKVLGLSNRDIAMKAWKLGEFNRLYQKLLEALPTAKIEKLLLNDWKRYFLAVNSADPYLPFELLPKDWLGNKCEKEFIDLGPKGFLSLIIKKIRGDNKV